MKKNIFSFILLFIFSGFSFSVGAQDASISGNEKDGKVLGNVLAENYYEMMLVKMAILKAQDDELKQAIMPLLEDHQRFDAELTSYANKYTYAIDPKKREKFTDKLNKWDKDPAGAKWDKDLIENLVDMHKDGIDMLTDAEGDVKDDEFKKLIASSVAFMRSHLDVLLPLKGRISKIDADNETDVPRTMSLINDLPAGNKKDAKFFSDLLLLNVYQLQLMEITFKKSGNRDLKNAAQSMIVDHQRMDKMIRAYAASKKYGMDPDEGSKTKEKITKWKNKRGGMEWDADIIEELIDTHKDGIDMLQDAKTDVKDDQLKDMMEMDLMNLQKHYKMLEPLKEIIKKPWKNKK